MNTVYGLCNSIKHVRYSSVFGGIYQLSCILGSTRGVISYDVMKRAVKARFMTSYEITTSVRFCYNMTLKIDQIAF